MRTLTLCALALVAGIFGATEVSSAQSYPVRAVRIIVPFPPGEAADIIARLVSPVLSQRMGQQFVVDNRPGAAGQIGLQLLKQAPADGYTIGMGQGGNMSVQPHTYAKLPYDALKDFAGLALAATNYLAVVANPGAPFKTAREMIEWAKKNPGKLSVVELTRFRGHFNLWNGRSPYAENETSVSGGIPPQDGGAGSSGAQSWRARAAV